MRQLPQEIEVYGYKFTLESRAKFEESHNAWWVAKYVNYDLEKELKANTFVHELQHICGGIPEVLMDEDDGKKCWGYLIGLSIGGHKDEAEKELFERLERAKIV